MDLHERIRNAPPKWIHVENLLPDEWAKKSYEGYCSFYSDYKYKVLLSNGIQYYSHFRDGKWLITQKNPRFIVTHWVKPIFIA